MNYILTQISTLCVPFEKQCKLKMYLFCYIINVNTSMMQLKFKIILIFVEINDILF